MIDLAQARPGFHVYYQPAGSKGPEYGVITSVSEKYVHVRFGMDEWSKACYPDHLHWPPAYVAADGACPEWQVYQS